MSPRRPHAFFPVTLAGGLAVVLLIPSYDRHDWPGSALLVVAVGYLLFLACWYGSWE